MLWFIVFWCLINVVLLYVICVDICASFKDEIKEYRLKSKPVMIQMFEVFLVPYDIIKCFVIGLKEGGFKYCLHNTFVGLSRDYAACYVLPWSLRSLVKECLATTLSDITGKCLNYKFMLTKTIVKHYTYHLNPFVRQRAKRILSSLNKEKQNEVY